MAYIGKGLDNGVRNQFIFAATQGQTAFSGADSDGKTLAISDILYTDCFQNGVKLEPTTDYTVTLTSLTLVNAASLNDVVDIVSFDIFAVPDTVPASTGGAFAGGISATTGTFSGALSSTGIDVTGAVTAEGLTVDGSAVSAVLLTTDSYTSGTEFKVQGDGSSYIYNRENAMLRLGTNNLERLRITADGRGLSQFTAKAWVNFNGTGTVAIRDSHNVSSITDNGTGDYTVNFSNNMANVNYSTTYAGGQKTVTWGVYLGYSSYGSAVGSHRFFNVTPGDQVADTSFCSLMFFGD